MNERPLADSHRIDALAQDMTRLGYHALLSDGASSPHRDALWESPDVLAILVSIATNVSRDWLPRFLASELVFSRQFTALTPAHFTSLAWAYVRALKENASGTIADWGLLSGPDDTGRIGECVVFLGAAATPALLSLLDDAQEVPYLAPPGYPYEIRLGVQRRDFAALYLRHIHRIARAGDDRETTIAALRRHLQ